MQNIIFQNRTAQVCPETVLERLPWRLADELRRRRSDIPTDELRLHRGGRSCLCRGGETVLLDTALSAEEMEELLTSLCGGSMYAHADTLRQGYVTLQGGIRVGVCGRMRFDGGKVLGISDVSSLVFRFPRDIAVPTEPVVDLLTRVHPGRGVLIYSPPGVGKTTLLRSLIRTLAAPPNPMRVAVVDTREELAACGTDTASCADWLSGYPRALGIEIATRTLSPRLIVCDEIGEAGEAEAICAACNAGVPLVATAHGSDVAGLLRRRGLRILHESGVFGSYVGLTRGAGQRLMQKVTLAADAGRVSLCGSS